MNYTLIVSFILKVLFIVYPCISDNGQCANDQYKDNKLWLNMALIACTFLFFWCLIYHNKWVNKLRCCCLTAHQSKDPLVNTARRVVVGVAIFLYQISVFIIVSNFK